VNPVKKVTEKIPDKSIQTKKIKMKRLERSDEFELWIMYGYDPVEIYQIEFGKDGWPTGKIILVSRQYTPWDCSELRGSGAPIQIYIEKSKELRFLALVHEAIVDSNGRHYFHRWIEFDDQFKINRISNPFYFDHKGIEFCRSICITLDQKQIIMATGIEDREAYFYIIDIISVWNSLRPIPSL